MGTLRRAGSFPSAEATGNALILSSRACFEYQSAEGIAAVVLRVRYRQVSNVRPKPSHRSAEKRNACSKPMLSRRSVDARNLFRSVGMATKTKIGLVSGAGQQSWRLDASLHIECVGYNAAPAYAATSFVCSHKRRGARGLLLSHATAFFARALTLAQRAFIALEIFALPFADNTRFFTLVTSRLAALPRALAADCKPTMSFCNFDNCFFTLFSSRLIAANILMEPPPRIYMRHLHKPIPYRWGVLFSLPAGC